jgi:hypothetical protein
MPGNDTFAYEGPRPGANPWQALQTPLLARAIRTRSSRIASRGAHSDKWRFSVHGAMCERDQFAEYFNFPQRWTIVPGVTMSSGRDPIAVATLSLNLLDTYFRPVSRKVFRSPDQRSLELRDAFATEILASLNHSSWHLPLDSLNEWYRASLSRTRTRPSLARGEVVRRR